MTMMAVSVYNQLKMLKKNLLPVLIGSVAGCATSIGSILLAVKLFSLSEVLMRSLLPKSVMTVVALDLSAGIGGIPAITQTLVIITGLTSVLTGPFLIRLLKLKPVSTGVAVGISGHAIGTALFAPSLGEDVASASTVAMAFGTILTVVVLNVFFVV